MKEKSKGKKLDQKTRFGKVLEGSHKKHVMEKIELCMEKYK